MFPIFPDLERGNGIFFLSMSRKLTVEVQMYVFITNT